MPLPARLVAAGSQQGLDAGLPVRDGFEQGEHRSYEGLRHGEHIKTATLQAPKLERASRNT